MLRSNWIELSERSVSKVNKICNAAKRYDPENGISVEMAKGIRDQVERYKSLSKRQAEWVVRNAEWRSLEVPLELANLCHSQLEKLADRQGKKGEAELTHMISKMERRLHRIETLLRNKFKATTW